MFLDKLTVVIELFTFKTCARMNRSSEYKPYSRRCSSTKLFRRISRMGISPPWTQTVAMSCSLMNFARYFSENLLITSCWNPCWCLVYRKSTCYRLSPENSSPSSTGCFKTYLSSKGVSKIFFLSFNRSAFTCYSLSYRFSASLCSRCTKISAISLLTIRFSRK